MTNAQFKALVLTVVGGMEFTEELTSEMFMAKLETLTKAKAPSKKLELEKQMVLDNLKALFLDETVVLNGQEIADQMKEVYGMDFTAQKVTANMKKLVELGEMEKIEPTKRGEKVTYKLA